MVKWKEELWLKALSRIQDEQKMSKNKDLWENNK